MMKIRLLHDPRPIPVLSLLIALLLSLTAITASAGIQNIGGKLLEPDVAYNLHARVVNGNQIKAQWTIANGYYMYRDKFHFNTDTPGITLGTPQLPPGKIKHDEFFGNAVVYRHSVSITVPVTRTDPSVTRFTLIAHSQGCADLGVCYPPHVQKVVLTLPAAPPSSPRATVPLLDKLDNALGLGNTGNQFLKPNQAFAFKARVAGPDTLVGHWTIADGYYLYRDKFKFKLKNADGVRLVGVSLPPGETKHDEFFGNVQVFHHQAEARFALKRTSTSARSITLEATYQGCAEAGICYPPITKNVTLTLPSVTAGTTTGNRSTTTPANAASASASPASATASTSTTSVVATTPAATSSTQSKAPLSEQDRLARFLLEKPLWLSVGLFFLLGLGLTFTPCVFPMIPILSSIIVGQGKQLTTARAFTMSLVYVLAMALTYTGAGVVVGLLGANLQAAFQNPWILSGFAVIFVLLSLSMFGFYELQMPNVLQSRLTALSNRQRGGSLIGVAIMGVLSALIVGPCVVAPLVGALLVIGQTGDAVLGGTALFAMSIGMGIPLLIIGASAGKLLPHVGNWMNAVKGVFGVLLLAVAIWMLERILPGAISLLMWAVLFIISAIYMGALAPIKEGAAGWSKLWKGLGLVLLLYGILQLAGVAAGGGDALQPLRGLWTSHSVAGAPTQAVSIQFKRVTNLAALKRGIAAASAQGKPVMVDYYADWCVSCKEYEKYTFADPKVQQALSRFVLLQADVTADNAQSKELLRYFHLIGPPSILFFSTRGKEYTNLRLVGYLDARQFLKHVNQVP